MKEPIAWTRDYIEASEVCNNVVKTHYSCCVICPECGSVMERVEIGGIFFVKCCGHIYIEPSVYLEEVKA